MHYVSTEKATDILTASLEALKGPDTKMHIGTHAKSVDTLFDGASVVQSAIVGQQTESTNLETRLLVFLSGQFWIVVAKPVKELNDSLRYAILHMGYSLVQFMSISEMTTLVSKKSIGYRGLAGEDILDKIASNAGIKHRHLVDH